MMGPPAGPLRRREVLRLGLVASTALAGCQQRSPGGSPPTTKPPGTTSSGKSTVSTPAIADRYGTVVNALVAGADPSGETPITEVLHRNVDDDTLLYFPDGRYAIEAETFRGLDNFGIAAAAGASPTFVPNAPKEELGEYLLTFIDVRDFAMEGLRFDFRREGYGGRVQVISSGDFTVRDIETIGKYPGHVNAFRFDVRTPNGTGLVEGLVANSAWQTNPHVTGVYVGHQHAGELTFRDCYLEGFSDNGLYASAPGGAGGKIQDAADGPVHVEGGSYRNNNVASVRLGSTGSTARGVTIVVDRVPPYDEALNARGLRLRAQRDQVIENCNIRIGPNAGHSFGAIVFHHDAGRALVRNTRIEVNRAGVPAINLLEPNVVPPTGPTFENVVITGSGSEGATAIVNGRDGTTFRRCCILQTGVNRNGIRFEDAQDCLLEDSTIDVTGNATITLNSTVQMNGVQYGGGC